MGDDQAQSACDPFGRVHGTENVYVADASLHPTNGSVNPALTVMANAYRVAEEASGVLTENTAGSSDDLGCVTVTSIKKHGIDAGDLCSGVRREGSREQRQTMWTCSR